MATVKLPGLEGHDWIDAREAAAIIGISEASVRQYARRGLFPKQKFGSSNVYDLKDIQRFAARRRSVGRPAKAGRRKA